MFNINHSFKIRVKPKQQNVRKMSKSMKNILTIWDILGKIRSNLPWLFYYFLRSASLIRISRGPAKMMWTLYLQSFLNNYIFGIVSTSLHMFSKPLLHIIFGTNFHTNVKTLPYTPWAKNSNISIPRISVTFTDISRVQTC